MKISPRTKRAAPESSRRRGRLFLEEPPPPFLPDFLADDFFFFGLLFLLLDFFEDEALALDCLGFAPRRELDVAFDLVFRVIVTAIRGQYGSYANGTL